MQHQLRRWLELLGKIAKRTVKFPYIRDTAIYI